MPLAAIAVTVTVKASGEAYVALVVGAPPEVRDSVALDALEAADAIPALDGLVLDWTRRTGRRAKFLTARRGERSLVGHDPR